jgi:hypothetical protein
MSDTGGRRARRAPPVPLVGGCEVHTVIEGNPIVKSELKPEHPGRARVVANSRAESSRGLAALPGSRR